jgi:chromate transporter
MTARRPDAPGFGTALAYWFRLGCISFGGPAGQIALMHEELVERRRWISERRFLHALNYCMLLPGPEAQQLATYIGWLLHRTPGALAAGLLFVLPSLLLLIGLSWLYMAWGSMPAVAGLFYGIKPAVTALVLQAAWRLGTRALRNRWQALLAALAFAAIFALQAPFPLIVLAAALAGWLLPQHFRPDATAAPAGQRQAPALIDDDTPPPAHARFRWPRFWRVLAVHLGLWLAPMAALLAAWGRAGVLPQMAWFFSKAALLTFGGAYAVLPYVFQGAVTQHHWLSAAQMMDGLALGETTPGPLIMVVSYVGFAGGWNSALLGPDALWPAAVLAALVVTYFTFLPSFLFILLGAPLIESSHGQWRLTAPLAAISAAVVGVILNLALFFAWHTLWPAGWSGRCEWPAAVIGVAAALALLRYRRGVIPVILASALAGLAVTLAA